MATAAAAGNSVALSEWAGKLAVLYGSEPERVRAEVAHLCDGLLSTWLSRAAVPFVERVKAEAERRGLTVDVVSGMPRLAEDRAEQNALLLWLDGWEHYSLFGGFALVPLFEGMGKAGADGFPITPSVVDAPPAADPPPEEREGKGNSPADAQPAGEIDDREELILREMYAAGIFTRRDKLTQPEIVARCQRNANPPTWKKNFSKLVRLGYLESVTGPHGGYWLTADGKTLAKKLLAE